MKTKRRKTAINVEIFQKLKTNMELTQNTKDCKRLRNKYLNSNKFLIETYEVVSYLSKNLVLYSQQKGSTVDLQKDESQVTLFEFN